MVHFVGAGSGAPDLITLRGKKFLEEADVVIYAGSLVNPQLLEYTKENCEIYNSAKMTLEEVLDVIFAAEEKGLTTVRLHTEILLCMVRSGSRWMFWKKKILHLIIARVSAASVVRHPR